MPQTNRAILFTFLTAALCAAPVFAQQTPQTAVANSPVAPPKQPTTIDKLARIRALIASRQLVLAGVELEQIKRESNDETVLSIVRTMLAGVYLEQPAYERVKSLLDETLALAKNRAKTADNVYLPVAGQVIKGAQCQLERYKKLGFNLSDANLPPEAQADLDKWRKLLETIVEQAKLMSVDEKKSNEAFAVLESAAAARATLARDEYEAAKWRGTMDDTRESMAAAQSKVAEVGDQSGAVSPIIAQNKVQPPINQPTQVKSPSISTTFNDAPALTRPAASIVNNETLSASVISRQRITDDGEAAAPRAGIVKTAMVRPTDNSPMRIASLIDLATRKVPPVYPPAARQARVAGLVKVEVVVNESGEVTDIKTADGPELLRRAAVDAARKWKFKPYTRDGQPARMAGFINFNFAL